MSNEIALDLLLVNGQRKEMTFDTNLTVKEITEYLFKNWPEEWKENTPPNAENIQLLHQGKFIEKDKKLPFTDKTVVHLVIRQPEEKKQEKCCTIL